MTSSIAQADSRAPLVLGPSGAEVPLVCPETRRPLYEQDPRWARRDGILDLVVGDRFDDHTDDACRSYEVESNTYSAHHFWIPLFQKLFPDYRARKYKILAIGCGVGVEVDVLCEAGFACFGVDNGNRAVDWATRQHREGLILANGMALPFAAGSFDAVFCGCVFPHVGVVGDTTEVAADYGEQRQKLADEMARVTRPGGHVIACCPNRRFPFDIFHGRKPGSYLPKFNPPWSHYLLSSADFRRMFQKAGCRDIELLPVEGFWGFVTMRRSLKGRILSWPIRFLFQLASRPAFAFLRGSPLVPWIAVHCQV